MVYMHFCHTSLLTNSNNTNRNSIVFVKISGLNSLVEATFSKSHNAKLCTTGNLSPDQLPPTFSLPLADTY